MSANSISSQEHVGIGTFIIAELEPVMDFVEGPHNMNRVFNPETGWEVRKITRDVPDGERHYYCQMAGVTFLVNGKWQIRDGEKSFIIESDAISLEKEFRRSIPAGIAFDDEQEFLRETIMPALRSAIVSLETRSLIMPSLKQQGWKVVVLFTNSTDRDSG